MNTKERQRIDDRLIALNNLATAMKFDHAQITIVARLYLKYGVPLDQLPYTETMERMLTDFAAQSGRPPRPLTLREFWTALLNLRKGGKLGKVRRSGKRGSLYG